jgi:hypothetical protein
MLAPMVEAWVLWVFLVGLAVGALLTWLVMLRLPRREDDVSLAERAAEAAWIGQTIERNGGIAPTGLVEEILDLHQAYLADAHLARSATPRQRQEALSLPAALPGWPVTRLGERVPGGAPGPAVLPGPGGPPGIAMPPYPAGPIPGAVAPPNPYAAPNAVPPPNPVAPPYAAPRPQAGPPGGATRPLTPPPPPPPAGRP